MFHYWLCHWELFISFILDSLFICKYFPLVICRLNIKSKFHYCFQETPVPPLITLDSKHANFSEDLRALDCVSERTHDTCHVFYVRANQKSPTEILNNVLSESMVSPQFFEILHSLGWPVAVGSHPGWTGHVRTSWKISDKNVHSSKSADQSEAVHGGCLYNGKSQVLYWADASSEIAFVVPTLDSISNSTRKILWSLFYNLLKSTDYNKGWKKFLGLDSFFSNLTFLPDCPKLQSLICMYRNKSQRLDYTLHGTSFPQSFRFKQILRFFPHSLQSADCSKIRYFLHFWLFEFFFLTFHFFLSFFSFWNMFQL